MEQKFIRLVKGFFKKEKIRENIDSRGFLFIGRVFQMKGERARNRIATVLVRNGITSYPRVVDFQTPRLERTT